MTLINHDLFTLQGSEHGRPVHRRVGQLRWIVGNGLCQLGGICASYDRHGTRDMKQVGLVQLKKWRRIHNRTNDAVMLEMYGIVKG